MDSQKNSRNGKPTKVPAASPPPVPSGGINPDFVERYQILYDQDPNSKVFAPLAEAYRKMGMLDDAYRVAQRGVDLHPHFPSGRVAYAKVLLDQENLHEAAIQLKAAADISPENILAHSLLAETLTKLRRPKDALKAFKMVLFLNPNDARAGKQVRRLESLTADEYDDEIFEMKSLPESVEHIRKTMESKGAKRSAIQKTEGNDGEGLDTQIFFQKKQRALERLISLADAFIVRSDIERAMTVLDDAENQIGADPEISKRKQLLRSRLEASPVPNEPEAPEQLRPLAGTQTQLGLPAIPTDNTAKAQLLSEMLHRINARRKFPTN